MRKTGYLGEGSYLMRNNLYGMNVERMTEYDVHELRIKDWESMIGTSIEDAHDLKKGQKAILGYENGNPITAGGQKNYIENVFEMGDGKLRIQVRETVPFGTGTKIDPIRLCTTRSLPAAHIQLSRARARTPSAAGAAADSQRCRLLASSRACPGLA